MTNAKGLDLIDLVIAPVATVLHAACDLSKGSSLEIAAQNVFYEAHGAFTGEWSAEHLRELGCKYAIVGHSERRHYFAETDEDVAKKVKACFEQAIIPIVCVGETLQERQTNQVETVLSRQVKAAVSQISALKAGELVFAYEPVWAIGTGLTASCESAQEAHHLIRSQISDIFDPDTASKTRIIYGGSVKSDNIYDLAKKPDIDGALVGGASLKSDSFLSIAREVIRAHS